MKHEQVFYTCEGCGTRLPEEGHTVVTAVFTGYRDPTPNDDKVWELCAQCWLDVFDILSRQDRIRIEKQALTDRPRVGPVIDGGEDESWDDELHPTWGDI